MQIICLLVLLTMRPVTFLRDPSPDEAVIIPVLYAFIFKGFAFFFYE
jgi:hypothetical protein